MISLLVTKIVAFVSIPLDRDWVEKGESGEIADVKVSIAQVLRKL